MGLGFMIQRADFDSCNAGWSYSGFYAFRQRLAEQIFGADISDLWRDKPGLFRNHPLNALLDHSDCGGELSYDQCRIIAPALREAIQDWPLDDFDRINAIQLAEGMESMGDCDTLEFC